MAVETITLGTLASQVLQVVANTTSTSIDTTMTSNAYWAIHKALRDFVAITKLQSFRADADLTLAIGTKDYALADDFMELIEPGMYFTASDYRTLRHMSEQKFRQDEMERSQSSGEPQVYILRNSSSSTGAAQVRLWPTPSAVRTVRYHYIALPAKLYDGTTSTVIDKRLNPRWHTSLVDGAVSEFGRRYLNVGGDWIPYAQAWQKAIEDCKKAQPPISGQVYDVAPYGGGSWGNNMVAPTSLGY